MTNTAIRFISCWFLYTLGHLINRLNGLVPDFNHAFTASIHTFLYNQYQYLMLRSCTLQQHDLKYWPWK